MDTPATTTTTVTTTPTVMIVYLATFDTGILKFGTSFAVRIMQTKLVNFT